MLILIVVTVTTAINGGLFESVKIASKKTERQSVLEELNAITAEFNADVYANPEKYDTIGMFHTTGAICIVILL